MKEVGAEFGEQETPAMALPIQHAVVAVEISRRRSVDPQRTLRAGGLETSVVRYGTVRCRMGGDALHLLMTSLASRSMLLTTLSAK